MDHGDITMVQCPECPVTKTNWKTKPTCIEVENHVFKEKLPLKYIRMCLPEEEADRFERMRFTVIYNRYAQRFPKNVIDCPKCEKKLFRDDLCDYKIYCPDCDWDFCFDCRNKWHGTTFGCNGAPAVIPVEVVNEMRGEETTDERKSVLLERWGAVKVKMSLNQVSALREIKKPEDVQVNPHANFERQMMLMRRKYARVVPAPGQLRKKGKIYEDDRGMRVVPCPLRGTEFLKSSGCNVMTCYVCDTKYCYLCGKGPPDGEGVYKHYTNPRSPCYNRCDE